MFLSYVDPITKIIGNWASEINLYSCILKIILSLILSAIIGYERSSKRHAAGLRTFIIVSLASTMAMIIDLSIDNKTSLMISAGTIIAVSIISANTILYSSKNQIKGLITTEHITCIYFLLHII